MPDSVTSALVLAGQESQEPALDRRTARYFHIASRREHCSRVPARRPSAVPCVDELGSTGRARLSSVRLDDEDGENGKCVVGEPLTAISSKPCYVPPNPTTPVVIRTEEPVEVSSSERPWRALLNRRKSSAGRRHRRLLVSAQLSGSSGVGDNSDLDHRSSRSRFHLPRTLIEMITTAQHSCITDLSMRVRTFSWRGQ